MNKYIILKFSSNDIIFDFNNISLEEKNHLNNNILFNDSLYYTYKYFINNYNKIYSLINGDYDKLTVKALIDFKYASILMINFNISKLYLDFPSTLLIDEYSLFLNVKSLKEIHCYYMPSFIKNKFLNKNINVFMYNNIKISDRFMIQMDAFDYETLYYIKNLNIREYYPTILNDIREFLRINRNLKAIHVYTFNKELIGQLSTLIENDESRDVIVFLHQAYDKGNFINNNFSWLRTLNKKAENGYICEYRIIYSNDFVGKNLFKQLTFNNLKLISILGAYVCLVCFIIYKSYSYVEKINIDKLNNELINSSYAIENDYLDELQDINDDNIDDIQDEEEKDTNNDKYSFDKAFDTLLKINKETVGFLVVNGTKVSYPVVQHSDNSYYVKKDFYKKNMSIGWIFLDYRNNSKSFDDNNIIFGHNMPNGTMFGSLKNVLNSSFRKKDENMIISYDTLYGSYSFKIFSAYKVDYTTDYLKTKFDSEKSFNDFVKLIKGRSAFKTNVDVKYGDKILTLTTCSGKSNQRLVVHAVLLKGE